MEKRLSLLEAEVNKLRKEVASTKAKSWERAIEKYAGDNDLQAVFSAAMKLREADRKRARRRRSKRAN
ncbi:MAG: hypothetical protein WD894_07080 [Pirellulales bacterium]